LRTGLGLVQPDETGERERSGSEGEVDGGEPVRASAGDVPHREEDQPPAESEGRGPGEGGEDEDPGNQLEPPATRLNGPAAWSRPSPEAMGRTQKASLSEGALRSGEGTGTSSGKLGPARHAQGTEHKETAQPAEIPSGRTRDRTPDSCRVKGVSGTKPGRAASRRRGRASRRCSLDPGPRPSSAGLRRPRGPRPGASAPPIHHSADSLPGLPPAGPPQNPVYPSLERNSPR
jgi:hypothetical protein